MRKISLIVLLIILFFISCSKYVGNEGLINNSNNNNLNDSNEVEENDLNEQDQKIPEKEVDIVEEKDDIEYINISPSEVRVPILMYHSISDMDPNNSLLVPPEMFNEQIKWLYDNKFTTMSMGELLESMKTGKVPKKPVVITFDDGYADNYKSAFPILKNYDMKATFFIITENIGSGDYFMNLDMLKEMRDYGMYIENHTSNHLELNTLSRENAYDSIKRGQEFIQENLGLKSEYLCYPVGRYNNETIEIAKELGIKAAVTTQGGISSLNDGEYELKRVRINPMSIENFAQIFSNYNN